MVMIMMMIYCTPAALGMDARTHQAYNSNFNTVITNAEILMKQPSLTWGFPDVSDSIRLPSRHGQWSGRMGAVVQEHMESSMLEKAGLKGWHGSKTDKANGKESHRIFTLWLGVARLQMHFHCMQGISMIFQGH